MPKLLITCLAALISLALLGSVASSCATQRQAQATIEVARVAQIASAGQSISTVVIAIMAVIVLGAAGLVAFLLFRVNSLQQQVAVASGNYLPGGGQRVNGQWLPGGGKFNGLPAGQDPNQQMMQLMMLQMMQNQQQTRALPAPSDDQWGGW